jgi:exopolyphosphatase / guanosine-5'-triphosphate,3'-diphosphate pyrophosphatase
VVLDLVELLDPEPAHGRHVARLALAIFDAARKLHRLGSIERELLEYAALLHDVGKSVSPYKHHRHSRYLILNSAIPGFDREEVRWIAAIARFHRGAPPRGGHPDLADFDSDAIRRITGLAAILRVADGLDHSHQAVVRGPRLARHAGRVVPQLEVGDRDPAFELWAARRKADLWERCFETELVLRIRRASGQKRAIRTRRRRVQAREARAS